jgi:hydroxypyruvate isomerase
MPKLAANLTMLFGDVEFPERFARAARAGFRGVEYLFPYDHDKHLLRALLDEHRLTQVLFNLPAGNWAAGERGIACHPDRVDEFAAGVERAAEYAQTLGCTQVNCLAGIVPAHVDCEQAHATFVANVRLAARRLAASKIRVLIEAINTRDVPGFFLTHTNQAVEVIGSVGSDNVFLQYDAYHMQIMEGDLATTLERHFPLVAHVQIADPPARNEPGTGEINFTFLLKHLDRLGYTGWVGCEYKPADRTEEGLEWARTYLAPGPP